MPISRPGRIEEFALRTVETVRLGASGTQSVVVDKRSPLERWFGGETRLEAARAWSWCGGGKGKREAEPNKLRTEFVADVHRLRGRVFKVQPHLRNGVIC